MKKILTVDDSKTMREMVSLTLLNAGYHVTGAEDGKAALWVTNNTQFDLVLTDLNMPNMDGLELIRLLRANPSYQFTPILMITTEGDESKKQEGRAAGATGWIMKPFKSEKLVDVVNKLCSHADH